MSSNIEKLKKKFGEAIIDSHSFRGDDTIIIKKTLCAGCMPLFKRRKRS